MIATNLHRICGQHGRGKYIPSSSKPPVLLVGTITHVASARSSGGNSTWDNLPHARFICQGDKNLPRAHPLGTGVSAAFGLLPEACVYQRIETITWPIPSFESMIRKSPETAWMVCGISRRVTQSQRRGGRKPSYTDITPSHFLFFSLLRCHVHSELARTYHPEWVGSSLLAQRQA